jgi:hypothetical protein
MVITLHHLQQNGIWQYLIFVKSKKIHSYIVYAPMANAGSGFRPLPKVT